MLCFTTQVCYGFLFMKVFLIPNCNILTKYCDRNWLIFGFLMKYPVYNIHRRVKGLKSWSESIWDQGCQIFYNFKNRKHWVRTVNNLKTIMFKGHIHTKNYKKKIISEIIFFLCRFVIPVKYSPGLQLHVHSVPFLNDVPCPEQLTLGQTSTEQSSPW